MTLKIVKDYTVVSDLDVMIISADMLRSPATHLFLASNTWDKVTVELCDAIPSDTLEYIPILSKDISVSLPESISEKNMKDLVALFPDKRGAIRRAFMAKSNMSEVVPVCTV